MRVLSLFDGMACGMLAMLSAGIKVDRYVAYEKDKYAEQTSSHNFLMIEHRGDVFQGDFTEFCGFDFVLAGFPCTKFSIAQKNDRETQPYSGEGWLLFEQAWRAVCEAKPKYFIFENNKSMAKPVQEEISKIIGFRPVCINSALVSAQNRQRLYWVGRRNLDGTYSSVHVDQPEDRGILLSYVLDMVAQPVNLTRDGKCQTIKAQYQQTSVANICCYTSTYGASGVAEPCRVGTWPNEAKNQDKHDSQQYRIYSTDGKGVTLCGNGGGLGAKTGLYAIPVEFDGDIPTKAISCTDRKTYTVYQVNNGQITINGKQYPIKLADGFYIIRKLTVRECMRLQTVPEWYEFPVSNAQAYKMLGNGWTVEVISHLIRATQENQIADEQLSFF